jgi:hypothetical protein
VKPTSFLAWRIQIERSDTRSKVRSRQSDVAECAISIGAVVGRSDDQKNSTGVFGRRHSGYGIFEYEASPSPSRTTQPPLRGCDESSIPP